MKQLESRVEKLFDAIKHGDQAHQDWLEAKIKEHFAADADLAKEQPKC